MDAKQEFVAVNISHYPLVILLWFLATYSMFSSACSVYVGYATVLKLVIHVSSKGEVPGSLYLSPSVCDRM